MGGHYEKSYLLYFDIRFCRIHAVAIWLLHESRLEKRDLH